MSVAEKMTAIADAIREKTGDTAKLSLDGMAEALRKLPGPIVATVSGNAIALSDATDLKLRGLKLFGKTLQDGTPTPEAPVSLVSAGDGGSVGVTVAGKNLYDVGRYPLTQGLWVGADGSLVRDAENSATESYIPAVHLRGNTLTLNKSPGGNSPSIAFYDANKGFLSAHKNSNIPAGTPLTFNVPENAVYMRFCTIANAENIQIEIGSTATEYEPYKVQTLSVSTPNGLPGIPVTSGGNYTDEAGQQWICDEVDFARGVYVQRVKENVFDSAIGWENRKVSENSQWPGEPYCYVYNKLNSTILRPQKNTDVGAIKSNLFETLSNEIVWFHNIGIAVDASGVIRIYWDGASATDTLDALFKATPMHLLYALKTPIETPLSAEELAAYAALHTNYPNTTILNDGGAGMEVKYVADTKNYIDNQIAAVAAAIVNA